MDSPNTIDAMNKRLLTIALKLRGVAYLIENQRGNIDPPVDIDDIHWGVGQLLTELSQAVETICEDSEFKL